MCNNKIKKMEEQLLKLKNQMNEIGIMRPGSLSQQSRMSKKAYGSYWHLNYVHNGKIKTEYVREDWVEKIKQETENYREFKVLLDSYVDLSIKRFHEWRELMKKESKNAKKGIKEKSSTCKS